ncbi:DNA-binding protein [Streptomyces fumigatiscleroticus]|nr:DNA-binding protein [Streptomyces fumigatiscleroticus]
MVAKDPRAAAVTRSAQPGKSVRRAAEGTAPQGAVTKRTAARATAARETAGPESAAGKGGAGRTGAVGWSTANKAGAAQTAEQTGATTVVAKKTPGTATAAKNAVPKARAAAVDPGDLAVRPGEDPWTQEEVQEARAELESEEERLRTEITSSERSLAGLMRDSGDGAGDDQADTGTKNITREHEMALAANAREMLDQTERALERLDAGTYGLCENCGNPIGKARMQAFPRATLCVECKQKQERRY